MKLKAFRISYIVILAICALIGFCLGSITFVVEYNDPSLSTADVFINVLCYFVGALFTMMEIFVVAKSFSNGTLLLKQISFTQQNKRRKITGIIASIIFVIGFFLFLFFLLMRFGCVPGAVATSNLVYEYLSYYGFLIAVNAGILLSYYYFLQFDDVSSFK